MQAQLMNSEFSSYADSVPVGVTVLVQLLLRNRITPNFRNKMTHNQLYSMLVLAEVFRLLLHNLLPCASDMMAFAFGTKFAAEQFLSSHFFLAQLIATGRPVIRNERSEGYRQ